MHEQHFKIENFRFVKDNKIYVSIIRDKISIPITIPREQFELWLLISQRLITIMVLRQQAAEPKEIDTLMSYDEYWKLADSEIHKDLYDYIVSHEIVFRNQVFKNPLVSINYGFNNHRATMN